MLYTYFYFFIKKKGKTHYDNKTMQYTAIFNSCKNGNFSDENFNIFAQYIDRGYTLEPPH